MMSLMLHGLKFQFLIGWLQTFIYPYQYCAGDFVSIPYRLATNPQVSALHLTFLLVSIPYRLATNFSLIYANDCDNEFQFLIGWLQTF